MSKQFMPCLAAFIVAVYCLPAYGQVELPEGRGKTAVQIFCLPCHDIRAITRSGNSETGWRNTLSMMNNLGSRLPGEEIEEVAKYLAANYPERSGPKAVLIPGEVNVSITEWPVPTPGSRPHDPLAAADGSLWYTGQFADVLGRLDPKTGTFKEYPLTPRSGPHGLTADKDGNIWVTENFRGHIGRLNPKTGEVKEYPMPDPAARDPHTPIFDRKGILWFTVQVANMVGRLDPNTGEIRLMVSPTPRSRPYGIVVNSQGIPFFVEFGSNKIARIDPDTMKITEYLLPHNDSRPRRIAITKDDVLWYSDYSRGFIGQFDPATGKASEWASPGGPKSQPYAIRVVNGIVWYSESGVEPNTLVRFDPKTEKFQTWPIPSGGGVVRNMDVTGDGDLVLACSGVNRIALVRIRK